MNRVIQTKDLICGNGEVSLKVSWMPWGVLRLGTIDNMPIWLPIRLIEQWDEIAELTFQEFIDARR